MEDNINKNYEENKEFFDSIGNGLYYSPLYLEPHTLENLNVEKPINIYLTIVVDEDEEKNKDGTDNTGGKEKEEKEEN